MGEKKDTILITGGAGFIGSYTAKALIEKGYRVVICDNLVTGKKENIHSDAVFYNMNIADPKLSTIFEKERPEYVYHFAFNVIVPKSVEDPLVDMDSIAGSLNILKCMRKFGARKIIFSSSGFIYGNNPNIPFKEIEPFQPISPYAIAKYTVENYLRFFQKSSHIPYVIFRYATTYGPGQIMGAMADYIRKLQANEQADIWGDGNKTRDYVYVDDVVRANILALELPLDYPDPVFNVSTQKEVTLNTLYATIARLLDKEPRPIYHPDRPGEQMRFSLDNTKLKEALHWAPMINIEEGLRRILHK